jgi:hypothetical protein
VAVNPFVPIGCTPGDPRRSHAAAAARPTDGADAALV